MFLEDQIKNLLRRVGSIGLNPLSEYVPSNKLRDEIALENRLHIEKARQAGIFAGLGHNH